MTKIASPFILLAFIGAMAYIIKIRMADKPTTSIQLRLALDDDYSLYLQEFQLVPQNKGQAIDCFKISYIKPQTQVRRTKLQINDCLLVIKSYRMDPATKTKSNDPIIVTLNSADAQSKLMAALRAPYKVELDFLREKKLYQWTYEIQYQ
jgi:hypothetical protein